MRGRVSGILGVSGEGVALTNVSNSSVYSKNPNFVFRKVAGEALLVPIRQRLDRVNSLYVLNETAAAIWDRIDGRASMADILDALTREFDVAPARLEQDAATLVNDLLSIEAIVAEVAPSNS